MDTCCYEERRRPPSDLGSVRVLVAGLSGDTADLLASQNMRVRSLAEASHMEARHLDAEPGPDVVVLAFTGEDACWRRLADLQRARPELILALVAPSWSPEVEARCLRAGADLCLTLPLVRETVGARLAALVRRHRHLPILRHGSIELDVARRVLTCGSRVVRLSAKEFDLMLALVEAGGEIVPRGHLLERIWGPDVELGSPLLKVLVSRVRRKLEQIDLTPILRVGASYRLDSGTAGQPREGAD